MSENSVLRFTVSFLLIHSLSLVCKHCPTTKNEKNKNVYSTSLQRNKMLRCMVVIFLRCVDVIL